MCKLLLATTHTGKQHLQNTLTKILTQLKELSIGEKAFFLVSSDYNQCTVGFNNRLESETSQEHLNAVTIISKSQNVTLL